jgi:hypothetical protein
MLPPHKPLCPEVRGAALTFEEGQVRGAVPFAGPFAGPGVRGPSQGLPGRCPRPRREDGWGEEGGLSLLRAEVLRSRRALRPACSGEKARAGCEAAFRSPRDPLRSPWDPQRGPFRPCQPLGASRSLSKGEKGREPLGASGRIEKPRNPPSHGNQRRQKLPQRFPRGPPRSPEVPRGPPRSPEVPRGPPDRKAEPQTSRGLT